MKLVYCLLIVVTIATARFDIDMWFERMDAPIGFNKGYQFVKGYLEGAARFNPSHPFDCFTDSF